MEREKNCWDFYEHQHLSTKAAGECRKRVFIGWKEMRDEKRVFEMVWNLDNYIGSENKSKKKKCCWKHGTVFELEAF